MLNRAMQAAVEYTEQLRWSVIPLSPNSKIPPKGFEVLPFRKRIASREEIETWWRKDPRYNIGIITGRLSRILGVDHDRYKNGYSESEVLRYIPDDIITPTSETAHGGQHQIFTYPEEDISIGVELIPGLDYRGEGGYIVAPPSVGDNGKDYKWIIGPGEAEPACMPGVLLDALINKKVHYIEGCNGVTGSAEKFFTDGRRDNDLFHVANCLTKGGMPADEIAQVLENLIISWGEKPDAKWISDKVESAKKRDSRRSGDVTKAIEEYVSVTDGYFSVTDCSKALQSVTDSEHTTFRVILHRLAKRGIIEKHGNKDGVYRRLNNELEALDWRNADITPLPLHWPFGIENLVSVYPGNIAVIAGAPNAGKTSFILNFIKLNQQKHEIHLFTSEGGKEELKMRISKFDLPLDAWTFSAWDRPGDFADVIKPGQINIIDYLEIHDEFYKIGGQLKAISDKVKDGFCLIALQKNTGRDEGLGGARGLEKPRLYLAMDNGQCKIVKGKSWTGTVNPNGLSIDFKLAQGSKFITESPWRRKD